jgi:hypothetical protein
MSEIFLEKFKKFIIFNKNKNLIFIFLLLIFFIPLFTSLSKYKYIKNAENKFLNLTYFANNTIKSRKRLVQFINNKVNSKSTYLESLEKLNFLEDLINLLNSNKSHIAFDNNNRIDERLKHLTSDNNKIKILNEKLNSTNFIDESILKFTNEIEVDEKDLNKILSIIEDDDENENKPQLIITNFSLKKLESSFLINLNILKREFYKKL